MEITRQEDTELIKRIKKENCSESIIELSKRHSGLFHKIAKKYSNRIKDSAGLTEYDYAEDKLNIIYDAALNYNPAKNVKFNTYFGNQVRFFCLNKMKKFNKYVSESFGENGDSDKTTNSILDNISFSQNHDSIKRDSDNFEYVVDIITKMNDDRITFIFQRRYFGKYKKTRSFEKIAKRLKISTQHVINLHNKGIKFLQQKLASNEYNDII